jgi:DNA-binding PadR family transcriptional regulator
MHPKGFVRVLTEASERPAKLPTLTGVLNHGSTPIDTDRNSMPVHLEPTGWGCSRFRGLDFAISVTAIGRVSATCSSPRPEDLLPLTPAVFHILLALADGEKHGYAIMQEVDESAGGSVRMGPGTLYGSLSRMLEAGLVEETERVDEAEPSDKRRRYYRLCEFGHRVLELESTRLAEAVRRARAKKILIHKPA